MTQTRRDVGEVLWFGIEGPELSAARAAALNRGEFGGVILFKRNLQIETIGSGVEAQEVIDLDALAALIAAVHRAAPSDSPALVSVDQEGGVVQRVRAPATRWPPMLTLDRLAPPDDVAVAEQVGRALGRELGALGFDVDFAPILDVHTNEANPIIGDRALGRAADTVARRALALARGLEAGGVLGCGKHFPGHGDTHTDSHLELPRIDHPWSRLEAVELAPFAAAAKADVPMVMTAHVVFAALDDQVPATLSPKAITGVLRQRLGYRGVIVSDDLDMKAIAANYGIAEAAVLAIRAGCDVLLCCRDAGHQDEATAAGARRREVERGTGPARRGGQRVRALKARAARARAAAAPFDRRDIGSLAHRQLADRLAGG
ncbi:MAG: beta-N-acetylhexosaminidase [Kofleriaceae bacterium]